MTLTIRNFVVVLCLPTKPSAFWQTSQTSLFYFVLFTTSPLPKFFVPLIIFPSFLYLQPFYKLQVSPMLKQTLHPSQHPSLTLDIYLSSLISLIVFKRVVYVHLYPLLCIPLLPVFKNSSSLSPLPLLLETYKISLSPLYVGPCLAL